MTLSSGERARFFNHERSRDCASSIDMDAHKAERQLLSDEALHQPPKRHTGSRLRRRVARQMQYFQNANSKQIVGHVESCACGDLELVEAGAAATVRGIRAIATATSILFMTVSS